jgi:diguanylate cyclase (GGDEF)-like protein
VIAERIRSSIQNTNIQDVTVSIGLAEFQDHSTLESFVKSADDALYVAKHSGGNQVCTNPLTSNA